MGTSGFKTLDKEHGDAVGSARAADYALRPGLNREGDVFRVCVGHCESFFVVGRW